VSGARLGEPGEPGGPGRSGRAGWPGTSAKGPWALGLATGCLLVGLATPGAARAADDEPSPASAEAGESVAASSGSSSRRAGSGPDPFESFNRSVFSFNEALDEALLEPVARAWKAVVPPPVRQGVRNVFGNVEDAWSALNHLLQGKAQDGVQMTVRFVTNTTIGIVGLFDVAGEIGLERRSEDFGQTLGRWGLPPGPYLVLPLLGPRSLRDGAAWTLDRQVSLANLTAEGGRSWALSSVELMQTRSDLLASQALLGQVALDRYTFVRDAYLARRRSLVYDGNPPPEPEDDDSPAPSSAPRP